MFGKPSRTPGVLAGIGRGIEQHYTGVEHPATGRHDFDVDLPLVPVTQRIANVDSIFDAGRELFGFGQIVADDRLGALEDAGSKVFDPSVFGRVAAMAVRIPFIFPSFLLEHTGAAL